MAWQARGSLATLPAGEGRVRPGTLRARRTLAALGAVLVAGAGGLAYRAAWTAARVQVPRLVGRTVAEAAEAARPLALGLVVTSRRQDPGAGVGVIVAQDPPPGSFVLKESTVRLTVSQGSGNVPDVRGLALPAAIHRLESVGLRLGRVSYASGGAGPPGRIRRQTPAPGIHLPANGAVDVVVNGGPWPAPWNAPGGRTP
jgi:beta-lactam-binding protein with PASTA domain